MPLDLTPESFLTSITPAEAAVVAYVETHKTMTAGIPISYKEWLTYLQAKAIIEQMPPARYAEIRQGLAR